MASAPDAPATSGWYKHDIYVNFADPLGAEDAAWVSASVADIERHLGGPSNVSIIRRDDPIPPTPGASADAALMLLFLTPAFSPGKPGWSEAESFHTSIAEGQRTPDQLVVCELRRFPDERRDSLPWASAASNRAVTMIRLFNSLTQVAFSAKDAVQENRWRLSSDIALRLKGLRDRGSAASSALARPAHAGPVEQAYLMEYDNRDVWSRTRNNLLQEMNLMIHPDRLESQASNAAQRRLLREQRRRLLENCRGLLLVRGAVKDNLVFMASDASADVTAITDASEGGASVRTICIDWVGTPPPEWPANFRPEMVQASEFGAPSEDEPYPAWVAKVRELLARGADGP